MLARNGGSSPPSAPNVRQKAKETARSNLPITDAYPKLATRDRVPVFRAMFQRNPAGDLIFSFQLYDFLVLHSSSTSRPTLAVIM